MPGVGSRPNSKTAGSTPRRAWASGAVCAAGLLTGADYNQVGARHALPLQKLPVPDGEGHSLPLEVFGQAGAEIAAAELAQGLGLDLAHPLTADAQLLADVALRLGLAAVQAEA